jgi:hypothetical protein
MGEITSLKVQINELENSLKQEKERVANGVKLRAILEADLSSLRGMCSM